MNQIMGSTSAYERSDELELADYSRRALVYDMDKLKRPASDMRARMDYV